MLQKNNSYFWHDCFFTDVDKCNRQLFRTTIKNTKYLLHFMTYIFSNNQIGFKFHWAFCIYKYKMAVHWFYFGLDLARRYLVWTKVAEPVHILSLGHYAPLQTQALCSEHSYAVCFLKIERIILENAVDHDWKWIKWQFYIKFIIKRTSNLHSFIARFNDKHKYQSN